MFVTPAVAGTGEDGTVYAGSCAGAYYAWDLETGEERWRHDFLATVGHATFHGDPLLTPDVLVTGMESLDPVRVYAFAPATGEVLWRREGVDALTRSDIVGVAGLAVGRNHGGELVALDLETGETRWRVSHAGGRYPPDVAESPAVVGGDVVFSAPDGALYRVRGATGELLWRTALECDVTTSVAAAGGDVYAGCRDGRVFRLRADDGGVVAAFRLPSPPEGRLAVTADAVIVPGGVRWIGAVDRALERTVWEYRPEPPVRLSVVQPLVRNGAVLTGTGEGEIVALDLADGSVRWTARLEGSIRGLGSHGNRLLVGTIEGTIFAVDAAALP